MKTRLLAALLVLGVLAAASVWVILRRPPGRKRGTGAVYRLVFDVQSGDLEREQIARAVLPALQQRIDPDGIRQVKLSLLGAKRIEVRLPAGNAEAVEARLAYEEALAWLAARNVTDSELRQIVSSPAGQVDARIDKHARGSAELARLLRELVKRYQTREAAAAGGDEAARSRARLAYAEKRQQVEAQNVSPALLAAILRTYVRAGEGDVPALSKQELARRVRACQAQLEDLKAAHPPRAAEIEAVAAKYRAWASKRPPLADPADLKRRIARGGVLEFRIAPAPPGGGQSPFVSAEYVDRYLKELRQPGGPDEMHAANERFLWFPIATDESDFDGLITGRDWLGKPHVLLYNHPEHMMLMEAQGGWRLSRAYETTDARGLAAVGFELDERGAERFARLTSAHKRWRMAILLDDEAYSAPVIKEVISRRGIIEMGARPDPDEVKNLVRTLGAALTRFPWRLSPEPVSESIVRPSADSADYVSPRQGTQVTFAFRDDATLEDPSTKQAVLPSAETVRCIFRRQASKMGLTRIKESLLVESETPPGAVVSSIERYDANGDARITLQEWTASDLQAACFRCADADADGALSDRELKRAGAAKHYIISTAESDAGLVREAVLEAFGRSLEDPEKTVAASFITHSR